MPIALLIRHGRTTANADGVLAGWTEGIGLDETGQAQVGALADRLAGLPVRHLVTSPLQRCRESADLVGNRLGLTAAVVDELGECRYGAWTGKAIKDLAQEPMWRTVQDHPSAARFPDGDGYPAESLAQMQARALAAVRAVDAEVEQQHGADALWALVSHGDLIKALVSDAAGAHFDHFQRIVVSPASLSVVHYTKARPFLVLLNDTGADLARLVPPPPSEQDVESGDAAVGGGTSP